MMAWSGWSDPENNPGLYDTRAKRLRMRKVPIFNN